MGKKNRARISQCMIVKNEEKNIERALSWGKAVMWEQIVVDTGSTDGTAELARRLGAKVFHFPWSDDFAAAKNYAIDQAEGEWIAFLDADEYMDGDDAQKISQVLERITCDSFDGVSTGWQQIDDAGRISSSGTQIRFFRNKPDIRYRRRIHEQLESVTGRQLRIGDVSGELSVFHTGYQKRELQEKKKNLRNRRLIQKELEDDPGNYEMMGYMGDECLGDGEREEAKQWYSRAVDAMPSQLESYDQRSAVTFTRLLSLLTAETEKGWLAAEPVYQKAVSLLPQEPDFDYVAGCWFVQQGQAEKAAFYLEEALKKLDTYGCYNKALLTGAHVSEIYDMLTRCCYESGESEKCVAYGVAYLKFNKYEMGVLSRVMKALLPDGGANETDDRAVLDFFSKLYDFKSLKDRLFLVKAAERSDCCGFAAYGTSCLFTKEEQMSLRLDL